MSVMEPITTSNSTTGAGVIDSWHSFASEIDEIKTAHGGDKAAIGVELGVTAVGAVLDTVAFALDPFAKLIAAGLGWLIEHVSFLRWPLDQIAGDPEKIKALAESLHGIGEDLRNAAEDLDNTLKATVTKWQGSGFDGFSAKLSNQRTRLDDAGHAVDTAGYVVETTMALIAAVRGLIRDIITTLLGDIISTMLTALALAVVTFGASIPAGVAKCVAEGTIQGTEMAAKLAKLGAFAGRASARIKQLTGMTKAESSAAHTPTPAPSVHEPTAPSVHDDPAPSVHDEPAPSVHDEPATNGHDEPGGNAHEEPGSSSNSEDEDPFQTWLAADQHFNGPGHETPSGGGHTDEPPATPPGEHPPGDHGEPAPSEPETPASTHDEPTPSEPTPSEHGPDEPAPRPDPKSALKDQDIALLKKHEDWLKANFKESQAKAKFVDNWLKKYPDVYPMVKALADAKSSKNWVGWVGKDIVTVDKQLTDIQQQADEAWQKSDERWRDQHPSG